MNCYEIWTDLLPGTNDLEFVGYVRAYLDHLKAAGHLENYRIRRRKLGFGPPDIGEWNITMEYRDLRQLEDSWELVARRTGETEGFHAEVWSRVQNVKFALYRDFPDEIRVG